ncbi:MAG TPA: hypothetical protein VIM31_00850 [Candidatus Microsaccharimonas sp.]
MTNTVRKTIGFILTIIVSIAVGYYTAWNQVAIEKFIASIGGLGNILVAIIGLAALVLAIFWPKRWREWVRKLLIASIILVLIFGAGRVFGDAFAQAPWLTVLVLIGVIVVTVALYSLTVLDAPIKAWRVRFSKKHI